MGNTTSLLSSSEIKRHYTITDKLGEGSFAVVKKAQKKSTGELFAVKIIKKNKLKKDELSILHDEVSIMHKIRHPNCVQLFEIYESKKKLYMIIELLAGGELFDRILEKGSYSEKEASELLKTVVCAIQYLHSIGIVHRDLKPENLIYANKAGEGTENVKITDFGLAKYRGDESQMNTACGTPGYVAPEVLKNEPYGPPVDMWSIGVILFILLVGFPPFYHQNTAQLYKQIKKGQYDFAENYWGEKTDESKNLIRGLLTVDPAKRLTPQQVLDHPWVSGGKASTKAFSGDHGKLLRLMQARRVLRRGVRSIIAINKFSRTIKNMMK